jgi:hypothetical protein
MLIFTYGSNMHLDRLRVKVSSERRVTAVFIRKYEIRFNKRSDDGFAKANIISTGNDRDFVDTRDILVGLEGGREAFIKPENMYQFIQ